MICQDISISIWERGSSFTLVDTGGISVGKMTFSLKYILLKKIERLQENDQNDERLIKQDDSLFSLEKNKMEECFGKELFR